MAKTEPKIVEEITHVRTGPFAVNLHSDDFTDGSLNVELIAAPTRNGSATYLTHVSMGLVVNESDGYISDCNISLTDGVGMHVFGPVQLQEYGQSTFSKDFTKPLKITDNKALDITGCCGTGYYQAACWVFAEYYTGDAPIT